MNENDEKEKLNEPEKLNDVDKDGYKTVLSLRISYFGLVLTVMTLIAFGIIFFMFMNKEKKREYAPDTPRVMLSGDSIFAYYRDERSVASKLSEKLGEDVFDASFGGTCLSYQDRDGRLDEVTDSMSMAALTTAIIAGDFRYQKNSVSDVGVTAYFGERLESLEKTDFSKVDVLFLEYLINDYHNSVTLKAGSDKYDEYTYEGALRSVVKRLSEEYPNLEIVIVAPPVSFYPMVTEVTKDDGTTEMNKDYSVMISAYEKDFGGGTVTEYRQVQKAVADEMGLSYLDLSSCYGTTDPEDAMQYLNDGIHPNELGAELIADRLYEYLNETDDESEDENL